METRILSGRQDLGFDLFRRTTLTILAIAFLDSSGRADDIQRPAAGNYSQRGKPVPAANVGTMKFHLNFTYQNFPMQMKVFELTQQPAGRPEKVVQAGNIPFDQSLPFSKEFADRTVEVPIGTIKKFALAIRNDTDQRQFFYVSPHRLTPAQYSLATKFICLCFGHIFRVNPKSTWYKIVELKVEPTGTPASLEIGHEVIGISEEEILKLQMGDRVKTGENEKTIKK